MKLSVANRFFRGDVESILVTLGLNIDDDRDETKVM
jgi:hypothetical protein